MERNFCLLVFFTCTLFAKPSFWFAYRVDTQNKQIIYEEKNISPLMDYSKTVQKSFLCKVLQKKNKYESSSHYLRRNFDELLPCFYLYSSKITNQTIVEMQGIIENTSFIILPIKFTVDFKDQFANISVLK